MNNSNHHQKKVITNIILGLITMIFFVSVIGSFINSDIDKELICTGDAQDFSILLNTPNYQWEDVHNPIESCQQCDHSDSLTLNLVVPDCNAKVILKNFIFNDGGDVFVNGVSLRENTGMNTDCNYMAENTRCSTEQEGISCRKVDGDIDISRFVEVGENEIKVEYCDKSGPAAVGFVHTYFELTCQNPDLCDVECTQNSQCGDNNPLTYDQCLNPGTTASSCRHTPINCASNSDCGFTGFVGNEF
ncbi:MAG: hypothetical protein WC584_05415, partial [Candidatus Pacearchaeota archaeon]